MKGLHGTWLHMPGPPSMFPPGILPYETHVRETRGVQSPLSSGPRNSSFPQLALTPPVAFAFFMISNLWEHVGWLTGAGIFEASFPTLVNEGFGTPLGCLLGTHSFFISVAFPPVFNVKIVFS